jgi:hypothetical protein
MFYLYIKLCIFVKKLSGAGYALSKPALLLPDAAGLR